MIFLEHLLKISLIHSGFNSDMLLTANFSEDRVRGSLTKLQKGRQAAQQARIDSFFSVSKVVISETTKRKAELEKNNLKKRGPSLGKKVKK